MRVERRNLALLGLAATSLPLLAAGALALAGPRAGSVIGLEDALGAALVLAGAVVAVLWPLLALAPDARGGGARARALELLVLGASFTPALRLAALLSRAPEEAYARAFVALAALAVAQGVAISGVARTRLPRSIAVAFFAALAAGLPLAALVAEDAFGQGVTLGRASIPAALLAQLRGEAEPWPLALGLVLLGALGAGGGRLLVVLVLVATPVLAGDLELERDPEPFLGPRARPAEPAPLRVRVKAGPNGFEGELGARSGGLLVLVPLHLPPSRPAEVAIPAIGDSAGTPLLEVRPREGPSFPLGTPEPVEVVPAWAPFVGIGPLVPRDLARALQPPQRHVWVSHLASALLDLGALGGGALDVLAAGRGADPRLAAFAATGGTLVLPDAASLEALAIEGVGPPREQEGVLCRGLGAGSLLAPTTSASLAALTSRLALVARSRPDMGSVGLAIADAWPEPAPSPRITARIALDAGVLLLVLVVLLLLPTKEPRSTASFVLASLALTVALPWLVLGAARAPVYLEAATVLEAPSEGSLAGATELLRVGSPRRSMAEIGLVAAPPLAAVFATEADAARSRAELHLDAAPATLEPLPARLRFPLAPGAPWTFARRSMRSLGGSVALAPDSVRNGLAWALEQAILVNGKEVVELGDLAPGEERAVKAAPVAFDVFLRRARARPTEQARERLALLTAALPARGSAGTLRLAAFLSLPASPKTRSGVLEESAGETLLVVTAR
jgi:hypothetical protein